MDIPDDQEEWLGQKDCPYLRSVLDTMTVYFCTLLLFRRDKRKTGQVASLRAFSMVPPLKTTQKEP